jgi:hypothetical protein
MFTNNSIVLIMMLIALSLMACNDENETIPTLPLVSVMVENLHAPADVVNRQTGEVTQVNPFVYFSFDKQSQVTANDSWDVAFKGTTLIVNSGISGNGTARAALMDGVFEEISTLPENLVFNIDNQESLAIPSGSGQGWYNYNFMNHTVAPIPGRILVFQTNEGKYVKMEIFSYYMDNPPMQQVTRMTPSAYYTFQYVLQPNGSRNFE